MPFNVNQMLTKLNKLKNVHTVIRGPALTYRGPQCRSIFHCVLLLYLELFTCCSLLAAQIHYLNRDPRQARSKPKTTLL